MARHILTATRRIAGGGASRRKEDSGLMQRKQSSSRSGETNECSAATKEPLNAGQQATIIRDRGLD